MSSQAVLSSRKSNIAVNYNRNNLDYRPSVSSVSNSYADNSVSNYSFSPSYTSVSSDSYTYNYITDSTSTKAAIEGLVQVANASCQAITTIAEQNLEAVKEMAQNCIKSNSKHTENLIEGLETSYLEKHLLVLESQMQHWLVELNSTDQRTKAHARNMITSLRQQHKPVQKKLEEKRLEKEEILRKQAARKRKIENVRDMVSTTIRSMNSDIQNASLDNQILKICAIGIVSGIIFSSHSELSKVIIFGTLLFAANKKLDKISVINDMNIKKEWMEIFMRALDALDNDSDMTVYDAVIFGSEDKPTVNRSKIEQNIPRRHVTGEPEDTTLDVFSTQAQWPPKNFVTKYQ